MEWRLHLWRSSIDGGKWKKAKYWQKNENARAPQKGGGQEHAGTLLDAFNGRLGVCSLLQWAKARHRLQTVFLFVLGGLYLFSCVRGLDGEGTG